MAKNEELHPRANSGSHLTTTVVLEPNVWVYRFVEFEAGRKRRRKTIVATQEQYPTRAAAERASEHLRLSANPETFNPECPTMGGLIDRYIEQILRPCLDVSLDGVQDSAAPMSFQCAKSYQSALNRWVRPHSQGYRLQDFNKPAARASIEEWLGSLWRSPKNPNGLAPKMVRSIWKVMKLAFKFAVKWGSLNENQWERSESSCLAAQPNDKNNRCS
jgi:hypothetical protein